MRGNRSPRGMTRPVTFLTSFTGNNGRGPCTASLVQSGDVVLSVLYFGTPGFNVEASFEDTVTTDGSIRQLDSADLSASLFIAMIQRGR